LGKLRWDGFERQQGGVLRTSEVAMPTRTSGERSAGTGGRSVIADDHTTTDTTEARA
jgi:hypothetical protein